MISRIPQIPCSWSGAAALVPHLHKRMEPAVFVAELRHRLLVPEAAADTWWPKCDGILDRHSLHAGTCAAGGESTLRHNAVRNLLCTWTDRAGLQPEKEKAEVLLPQRPEDAGLARRRPADIYLPAFRGTPTALDLAVTACQPSESLAEAGRVACAAVAAYARAKESHLHTADVCASQGVKFQPMVLESTGAWEASASRVLWDMARAVATREGEAAEMLHGQMLQELCVAVAELGTEAAGRWQDPAS